MTALMRRVHGLVVPGAPRVMTPAAWVDYYGAAADAGLRQAAVLQLERLSALARIAPVLCHSDLHRLNLIDSETSLILLDWEYAHVSDPLWDVAGWSANNNFGPQSSAQLLRDYLQAEPAAGEWARYKLLIWLYDYICLLWSELYLRLRPDASGSVAARATQLDARLRHAANYAA